jgi:putative peptidoglycan lipid II flippase
MAGGVLQWLAQIAAQGKAGMGKLRLRFNWRTSGVSDVMKVMIPATLSSGMLYINVSTNLFFASFIENAAASMRYANFIALTPLGIISNMILVPFMPIFSRLAAPEDWPELKLRIRQGLLLTALTMLPLTAIFMGLSGPIVRIIYQRGAFNADASRDVIPVLMVYGAGMFFYLGRDVLVRVFYALEDGNLPFRVSAVNIFLNGLLDFLFYKPLGTSGLVLATVGVNVVSMLIFLVILNRRLNGLPFGEWSISLLSLTGISAISGLAGWGVSGQLEKMLGTGNLVLELLQLVLSCTVVVGIFGIFAMQLKLSEVDILTERITKKFKKS